MKFYQNKGMYLESIIDRTINFYNTNDIGWFDKRTVPIKIASINNNHVTGYLKEKSQSDYYGIFESKMYDFEAKQTNDDFFNINNIKKHQILHLIRMKENGAVVFLIVYFNKYDTFFKVEIDQIISSKKKRIKYSSFIENATELKIVFPGILDILNIKKIA